MNGIEVLRTAGTAGFRRISLAMMLALFTAGHVAVGQSIPVGFDSTHLRPLPADGMYGTNAQQRGTQDWSDPNFHSVLTQLNQGILRIPAGTGADLWDWQTGTFLLTYPTQETSANNAHPSPLSEFNAELSYSSATPIFTINVLTDPTCTSNCTFSPSSPNLSYQMQLFATAPMAPPTGLGMSLPYVELGNEIYLTSALPFNANTYVMVYPTAVSYGQAMTNWIQTIKASYPNIKLAAVAAHNTSTGTGRMQTWNQGLFDPAQNDGVSPALQGEDAVTLHIYQNNNLPSNSTLDTTTAETMLAGPFLGFQAMQKFDFKPNGWIPTNIPVWFTEYNMNKFIGNTTVWDTWAHGLFLATMHLLFLQNNQIQKLAHHETVGDGVHSDIFADTHGLNGIPFNGSVPATVQWGFTAGGLVSMHINTAARGQSKAEMLTFNGAPSITVADNVAGGSITYPSLYGWVFSGADSNQAVILNLYNQPQTINLSGITVSGSYVQISGDPAAYITDGANLQAVNLNGVSDNLVQTAGTLSGANASSFVLPPFSFTRIIYGMSPSTTILATSKNPVVIGTDTTVTFTAAVTGQNGLPTPTGSVVFRDFGASLGTVPLSSGVASLMVNLPPSSTPPFLTQGAHSITAVYSGDAVFTASTSNTIGEVVESSSQTTATTIAVSVVPAGNNPFVLQIYQRPFKLQAQVTPKPSAIETVTFYDGTTPLGAGMTDVNGVATYSQRTLSFGTHPIQAVYAGDATFAPSITSVLPISRSPRPH